MFKVIDLRGRLSLDLVIMEDKKNPAGIPERRTALPPKREPVTSVTPKTALPPRRDRAMPSSRDIRKSKEEAQQPQAKGGFSVLLGFLLVGAVLTLGFFYLQKERVSDEGQFIAQNNPDLDDSKSVLVPAPEPQKKMNPVKIEPKVVPSKEVARKPISVWISWGQSNADGQGATGPGWSKNGRESLILHRWSSGTPPKLGASKFGPLAPKGKRLTPAMLPIRTICSEDGKTRALIEVAHGLTSLGPFREHNWQPTSDLYNLRINKFLPESLSQLRAMGYDPQVEVLVIFQGESDSTDTLQYASRITSFVNRIKQKFQAPRLKVIVCKTHHKNKDHSKIRAAHDSFAKSFPNAQAVETKDLDRSDHVHLSTRGMIGLSPRIVSAYRRLR